jgi:hypothetical protein
LRTTENPSLANLSGFGVDQEQRRLRVVDGNDSSAISRDGDAGERTRRLDLAEQASRRQVDHRDRGVFLVLGVEPFAVGRNDQAMAVGRSGIDRLDDFIGLAIDHRDDRAVLAGNIDQPVGPELERVRGNIGTQVDRADMRAFVQIENAQGMLRIGIAAVNAVAEDRHVGEAGLWNNKQFVHRARKAVDHHLGLIGRGIEEQDFPAHLVDCNHSV